MTVFGAQSHLMSKAKPILEVQLSAEKNTFARVMNTFLLYYTIVFYFLKHTNNYTINIKTIFLRLWGIPMLTYMFWLHEIIT